MVAAMGPRWRCNKPPPEAHQGGQACVRPRICPEKVDGGERRAGGRGPPRVYLPRAIPRGSSAGAAGAVEGAGGRKVRGWGMGSPSLRWRALPLR